MRADAFQACSFVVLLLLSLSHIATGNTSVNEKEKNHNFSLSKQDRLDSTSDLRPKTSEKLESFFLSKLFFYSQIVRQVIFEPYQINSVGLFYLNCYSLPFMPIHTHELLPWCDA